MKVPDTVGVPEMVKIPLLKFPETPAGRLPPVMLAVVAEPPRVYWMGEIALLIHTVWLSVPKAELNAIAESGLTVVDMLLLAAGLPTAHGSVGLVPKLVVRTTLTTSPLANEEVENVGLLVPAFEPLTRH